MSYTIPTADDFKGQFPRDFPYAVPLGDTPVGDDSDLSKVTDGDIGGAILDAQFNMNQGLFANQAMFTRSFLNLAAHYLVEKILAATEGLGTQYNWLTTGKSVGNVSSSYQIPDRISKDPMLSAFTRTRYGLMYVTQISPQLVGNIMATHRQTIP